MIKLILALIIGICFTLPSAHAADSMCGPMSVAKSHVDQAAGGQWIELTDNQRAFVAGVFVMNPATPPGLPFGDKAALVKASATGSWAILFLDGDQACTPMPIPTVLYEMIVKIGAGVVSHEGTEN